MYALFLLWDRRFLRSVQVLDDLGGIDLNRTAVELLRELQFGGPGDPDRCDIYITRDKHIDKRLVYVGTEVLQ